MSNISRRDFLKTAGVMTLAVAAAGVLAGCEGNKPTEPEVPVVTNNSVTVGNFAYTIKETKLVSVKKYDNDNGNSADSKVKSEDRYVIVLGYLKNDGKKDGATPGFNMSADVKGAAYETTEVGAVGVKKLFDLKVKPEASTRNGGFQDNQTNDFKGFKNTTAEGTPYYFACKVNKTVYADKTYVFEAPSIVFTAHDEENKVYTKLNVTIPADAVEVKEEDLKKA